MLEWVFWGLGRRISFGSMAEGQVAALPPHSLPRELFVCDDAQRGGGGEEGLSPGNSISNLDLPVVVSVKQAGPEGK